MMEEKTNKASLFITITLMLLLCLLVSVLLLVKYYHAAKEEQINLVDKIDKSKDDIYTLEEIVVNDPCKRNGGTSLIPQFNVNSEYVIGLNKSIEEEIKTSHVNNKFQDFYSTKSCFAVGDFYKYEAYKNDDFLSLVIERKHIGDFSFRYSAYNIHNVNLETGEKATIYELLSYKKTTLEKVKERITSMITNYHKNELYQKYAIDLDVNSKKDALTAVLNDLLINENTIFINKDNHLVVLVRDYTLINLSGEAGTAEYFYELK